MQRNYFARVLIWVSSDWVVGRVQPVPKNRQLYQQTKLKLKWGRELMGYWSSDMRKRPRKFLEEPSISRSIEKCIRLKGRVSIQFYNRRAKSYPSIAPPPNYPPNRIKTCVQVRHQWVGFPVISREYGEHSIERCWLKISIAVKLVILHKSQALLNSYLSRSNSVDQWIDDHRVYSKGQGRYAHASFSDNVTKY